MLSNILNKLGLAKKDFSEYNGIILPRTRSNEGLKENEDYLNSGIEQIEYLKKNNLLTSQTRILDFGCGQGRLLNTLKYTNSIFGNYVGLDTSEKSINWCKKYLLDLEIANFIHLPAANARYNPNVKELQPLPFETESFDLIFLNSVFSHMRSDDIKFYLNEFYKVLQKGGFVYLTAFIEDGVPNEEENPDNYLSKSTGPLHRVRFEKGYFFEMVKEHEWNLVDYQNQFISRTNQSVVLLQK